MSGERIAVAAEFESLSIEKDLIMWGDEPKAAATAEFSSLPIYEKHLLVTAALHISRFFDDLKRCDRHQKEKLVKRHEWSSYLTKKELMMWDLDQEEAENLYIRSQEKHYKYRCLRERLEKLKFEGNVIDPEEELFDKIISPLYTDVDGLETKLNQSDEGACSERISIYDDEKKIKILDMVESYRKKMNNEE